MKVIIDTNILISAAFRGGKPKMAIAHVIASSSFEWIASSEIIKEYKEVLNRPKLKLSQITKQSAIAYQFYLSIQGLNIRPNLSLDCYTTKLTNLSGTTITFLTSFPSRWR